MLLRAGGCVAPGQNHADLRQIAAELGFQRRLVRQAQIERPPIAQRILQLAGAGQREPIEIGRRGGIWALVLSWRHGGLKKLWNNMVFMWRSAWLSGFKEMSWDLRSAGAVTMPYGVALSAGAALVAIWQMWIRTAQ